MNKKPKNAKQFVSGCAGMTAGVALMLLGSAHWYGLLMSGGLTVLILTNVLSSSDEKADRKAPFLVLFFLPLLMAQVVCSIYLPTQFDAGAHNPSWLAALLITTWAIGLCWECWTYFRGRSLKDDDHAAQPTD
jgi:hypothetical protein